MSTTWGQEPIGLTALTFHYYEDRIRKSDWLLEKRDQRVSPAAWSLAGVAVAGVVVVSILGLHYVQGLATARDAVHDTAAPAKQDPCFGAPAMVTPGCVLRKPGVPLTPSIDTFAQDNQDSNKCLGSGGPDIPSTCEFGYNGPGAVRIALVGDSHAAALLPALWPLLEPNRWHLTTYLASPCILMDPPLEQCPGGSKLQSELIAHPYDLVLITNRQYGESNAAGYVAAWQPVAAVSRIAVVVDNPATSEEAMDCLTRVSFDGDHTGECNTPRAQAFRRDDLVDAANQVHGATLIDLSKFYCSADRCPSVIGNVIVYRDNKADGNSHITATFMQTLAPALEEGLKEALATPR